MKKEKKVNKVRLLKKLKKELWELCKQYVRKRDGGNCYTCTAKGLSGSTQQTGHCIPSVVCPFELDYHPFNLAVQCYHCNINCGGMGAVFINKIEINRGLHTKNMLFNMLYSPKIIIPTIKDYQDYIIKYKQLIKDLKPTYSV